MIMTVVESDDSSQSSAGKSDDDDPEITAANGLPLDVLEMLLRFQNDGCFVEDDNAHDTKIPSGAVCATYTARDSQVIAATCRRLQEKMDDAAKIHQDVLEQRILLDLVAPTIGDGLGKAMDGAEAHAVDVDHVDHINLAQTLIDEGVVRINQVLGPDLCDRLLATINEALAAAPDSDSFVDNNDNDSGPPSDGFGNVFSRHRRYDMYLRPEGVYNEALHALLDRRSLLGALIHQGLLNGQAGVFHEFSSLISDSGSLCQPIHPDSPHAPNAPMWTIFVALQDVTATMGPTVFLKRTHTQLCHDQLKSGDAHQKDAMLASCQYHRGTMQKGDAAIMDSRTMHFGSANESDTRRVVCYVVWHVVVFSMHIIIICALTQHVVCFSSCRSHPISSCSAPVSMHIYYAAAIFILACVLYNTQSASWLSRR